MIDKLSEVAEAQWKQSVYYCFYKQTYFAELSAIKFISNSNNMTNKTQKWRTSASLILVTPTSTAEDHYNVSCMQPGDCNRCIIIFDL